MGRRWENRVSGRRQAFHRCFLPVKRPVRRQIETESLKSNRQGSEWWILTGWWFLTVC